MKTTTKIKIALFSILLSIGFSSCSSDNGIIPCAPITCLNKGVSTANCGCDCPPGFGAADCSVKLIPKKIKVTKIRVTAFPNTNPKGNNWDGSLFNSSDKYPDILVMLSDSSKTLWLSDALSEKISTGNDKFDFVPPTPIEIPNILGKYDVTLFDLDAVANVEYMGGYIFTVYNPSMSYFPEIILLNSGNVKFEVYLSYEF